MFACARIANPAGTLKPGMFTRATADLGGRTHAIRLPEQVIVPKPDGSYVFLAVDGKAELRKVTLGKREPGRVEIVSGVKAADTLPPGTRTALDGQSREFGESGQTLAITFALALVIIYLVLAAQFESFVAPFIILLTVPLAATGALLALKLTGATLNVYSQIGLIMLVGLITKHGILIVEFANQLRDRGKNKVEAAIEAASLRLRPILMTTAAMVLGAVPLAIATGAGAESRSPIGWVIVGGLCSAPC